MKSTILVISLFTAISACTQKTPPTTVANAFTSMFNHAETVKWDAEETNEWEAEFRLNGKEISASFDLSGKWLETETIMNKNDLPGIVKTAINQQFADFKTEEVETIESPNFTGYEIVLKKKGEKVKIQITKNGKLTDRKESKGK